MTKAHAPATNSDSCKGSITPGSEGFHVSCNAHRKHIPERTIVKFRCNDQFLNRSRARTNAFSADLNQNQIDTLACFLYNTDPGKFHKSELRKLINDGKLVEATQEMEKYNTAKVKDKKTGKTSHLKLNGLVIRRAEEVQLFNQPVGTP